MNHLLLCKIS